MFVLSGCLRIGGMGGVFIKKLLFHYTILSINAQAPKRIPGQQGRVWST